MPRGKLRKDVTGWLRFGHAKRGSRARGNDRRGRIPDMVSIHARLPEVEEWLIPWHREGDLINGAHNRCSIVSRRNGVCRRRTIKAGKWRRINGCRKPLG
jgi:IS30 family transposase